MGAVEAAWTVGGSVSACRLPKEVTPWDAGMMIGRK